MSIHPTAIVADGAEIDATAQVGPYCVIGAGSKIGARSHLMAHVVIEPRTHLGVDNVVHPFARLGGVPQDLKFKGEPSRLRIGNRNVLREGVTLNTGTEGGRMETTIGDDCLLMAYAHVAHDCVLGNHVVFANSVALGGHVQVDDHVIMGGLSAVHQYCHIGAHGFIAGGGMVTQDVPPFCIAQGDRAQLVGVNLVGLKRHGWSRDRIRYLRAAYQNLFLRGLTRMVALERTEQDLSCESDDVKKFTDFIRQSCRGICPPRVIPPPADNFET